MASFIAPAIPVAAPERAFAAAPVALSKAPDAPDNRSLPFPIASDNLESKLFSLSASKPIPFNIESRSIPGALPKFFFNSANFETIAPGSSKESIMPVKSACRLALGSSTSGTRSPSLPLRFSFSAARSAFKLPNDAAIPLVGSAVRDANLALAASTPSVNALLASGILQLIMLHPLLLNY